MYLFNSIFIYLYIYLFWHFMDRNENFKEFDPLQLHDDNIDPYNIEPG